MIATAEITGVILCGGSARRMGGIAKPLAPLDGAPLVEHVRRRLAPQVGTIIISAPPHEPGYSRWGDQVVSDRLVDGGPLAGIDAALQLAATPWLFCCPGDAPLLDTTLVARLAAAIDTTPGDVAIPHDGEQTQQLFLLLRTTLRQSLADYLDTGGRSVLGWTDRCSCLVVAAADIQHSFLNINTTAALADAEQRLGSASGASTRLPLSPLSNQECS
ncbi:MAG: molybdenum cofactor guanylyltransferase MobA [Gemmatimonadales bacterium]|nr:molybdenum cofactor guanylyltransferase MobA [Gemmatimonadales bacterium]MDZ4389031.1 molybdenum cofactor guanylyltransferase MobA [Gemmatimonadales bacterium]